MTALLRLNERDCSLALCDKARTSRPRPYQAQPAGALIGASVTELSFKI